ncbi:hypothetical protein [Nocardia sp. NPDC003963]
MHHLDWRVRAALAESLPGRHSLGPPQADAVIEQLATDHDYKVRAGLARIVSALDTPNAHRVFRRLRPPTQVAKLVTRIQLLSGVATPDSLPAGSIGLIGLLKEMRSEWITLLSELEESLVSCGERSTHWLTAREASAVRRRHEPGTTSIHE